MKRYTKKEAGALGGSCAVSGVSEAKKLASAENGKKGGRPRREITVITSHRTVGPMRFRGTIPNNMPTLRKGGIIAGYILHKTEGAPIIDVLIKK